jgi:hypothetical protein
MKKILFVIGLILGIALFIILVGFLFYSQIEQTNLAGKKVFTSEDDEQIMVSDENENIIFSYSIEEWQKQAGEQWNDIFVEPLMAGEDVVGPESFVWFTAVSAFPGMSKIGFSVSTYEKATNVSLFWTIDIATKEINIIGEKNIGIVGNIVWSPNANYFAYSLNDGEKKGEFLTADNTTTLKKEFVLTGEDILHALEGEYLSSIYYPNFRNIEWKEDESELIFTTNSLEETEETRWSINLGTKELIKI